MHKHDSVSRGAGADAAPIQIRGARIRQEANQTSHGPVV